MRRVDKPWGHELIWAETERYVGKILHIEAGQKLSRQYHNVKDETFLVQSGEMDLEVGDGPEKKTLRMKPSDAFHCPPKTIHRMVAVTDVDVLEVSTPELGDVVRLEDAPIDQSCARSRSMPGCDFSPGSWRGFSVWWVPSRPEKARSMSFL
jgi:mannose-6-phosphate isomerase